MGTEGQQNMAGNKCGRGYGCKAMLEHIQSPEDCCCDVCEGPVLASKLIWYCEPCDWGCCQTCADERAKYASNPKMYLRKRFPDERAVPTEWIEGNAFLEGCECEDAVKSIEQLMIQYPVKPAAKPLAVGEVCPICAENGWDSCATCTDYEARAAGNNTGAKYAKREAGFAKGEGLTDTVQYPGDDKRKKRPVEGVPDRMLTKEQYEVRKSYGTVLGMGSLGWRTPAGTEGGWKSPLEHEASTIFSTIDVDKSGLITPMEFETRLGDFGMDPSSTEQLFLRMDANADGFISESEFVDAYPDWALECNYETGADKDVGWTEQDKPICLDVHNRLRKLHDAKPLKWCDALAKKAQKAANICELEKRLYHPVAGANNAADNCTFEEAICMWWEEVYSYNWEKPNCSLQNAEGYATGHFTQVVWGSATKVGMARSTVGNGSVVFAFYDAGTGAGIDTRAKHKKRTWLGNVKINKAGRNVIRTNIERMGINVHGQLPSDNWLAEQAELNKK